MLDALKKASFPTVLIASDFLQTLSGPLRQLCGLQPPAIHVFALQKDDYKRKARFKLTAGREAWACGLGDASLDRQNSLLAVHSVCVLPAIRFWVFAKRLVVFGNFVVFCWYNLTKHREFQADGAKLRNIESSWAWNWVYQSVRRVKVTRFETKPDTISIHFS